MPINWGAIANVRGQMLQGQQKGEEQLKEEQRQHLMDMFAMNSRNQQLNQQGQQIQGQEELKRAQLDLIAQQKAASLAEQTRGNTLRYGEGGAVDRQIAGRGAVAGMNNTSREGEGEKNRTMRIQIEGMPARERPGQGGMTDSQANSAKEAKHASYERNPVIKNAYDIAKAVSSVQSGLSGDTPTNDLAIIYSTIKMFDPSTGVKEGETKLFRSAASIPQKAQLVFDNWNKGRMLTPEMRANIAQLMEETISHAERGVKPIQARYGADIRQTPGMSPSDSAYIAPSPMEGVSRTGATPAGDKYDQAAAEYLKNFTKPKVP